MKQPVIVFGAALKKDGRPHRALIARLRVAVICGKRFQSPLYIVTGGNPQAGMTEAEVMRDILVEWGIPQEQILCENEARKTIESAFLCHHLLEKMGYNSKQNKLVLVSSAYHYPRCWWLFFLLGWKVCLGGVPKIMASRSFLTCWKRRLREIPGIIWDSFRFIVYYY